MRYLGILFLFAMVGCNQLQKKAMPSVLYKMQSDYADADSSGLENMVLHFNDDGTYSHFAANFYNYGKWRTLDGTSNIVLMPEAGYPMVEGYMFEIKKTKAKDDQFEVTRVKKEAGKFVPEGGKSLFLATFKPSVKDAFSADNNTWRIKPTQLETPDQIKKRTVNYLKFLAAYYQHAMDNNLPLLTSGWYPTPIQMHFANGARLAYQNELFDWNRCFYNEDQAVEGYKVISGPFRKVKILHTDSKAERNLDVIKQLLAQIK